MSMTAGGMRDAAPAPEAVLMVRPALTPEPALAPDATVTRASMRNLMQCFPTGVAVVTSTDHAGQPRGMTCTSLSSVTLEPPSLLVCLNGSTRTLAAIRAQGVFAVNLLHADGQRAAEVFSQPLPDRFSRVSWQATPVHGQPWLIRDAFAMAECQVSGISPVGDHVVIVGMVVNVSQHDAVPLLYGFRRFSRWAAAARADLAAPTVADG
jgi:flavin reductase (DIM6/NTAB) family NADH-FMN oxidoreductase RutF